MDEDIGTALNSCANYSWCKVKVHSVTSAEHAMNRRSKARTTLAGSPLQNMQQGGRRLKQGVHGKCGKQAACFISFLPKGVRHVTLERYQQRLHFHTYEDFYAQWTKRAQQTKHRGDGWKKTIIEGKHSIEWYEKSKWHELVNYARYNKWETQIGKGKRATRINDCDRWWRMRLI